MRHSRPTVASNARDLVPSCTLELRSAAPDGSYFEASLPAEICGRWCRVTACPSSFNKPVIARVQIAGEHGIIRSNLILAKPRWRIGTSDLVGMAYIHSGARRARFEFWGDAQPPERISVTLRGIPRTVAAMKATIARPGLLARAILGTGWKGLPRRVRSALSIAAMSTSPLPFRVWLSLFDTWSQHDNERLLNSPRRQAWPRVAACLFYAGRDTAGSIVSSASHHEGFVSTLQSVNRQLVRPVYTEVIGPQSAGTVASALQESEADYFLLLQAGETLPPHALAAFSDWVAENGSPSMVYCDEVSLLPSGFPRSPVFKPEPNHSLMLSATLTRGAWLVRRDVLARQAAYRGHWAEVLRLTLWLQLYERDGAKNTRRIPYILSHRRWDAEAAPPLMLADAVNRHLACLALPARAEARWPIRVGFHVPEKDPSSVSIIVPSTCKSPHTAACLAAILQRTAYPKLNLVVVITQNSPLDAKQARLTSQLASDRRVRVLIFPRDSFNYSAVNNFVAATVTDDLICLLNDDVEPLRPNWLGQMIGHLCDPRVGIVGAKLYYPNQRIQHAGVIMGLGGLGEHANRLLRRRDPGYAWRAILDQEFSAVTGACMMIRRSLYQDLGGLDETFPSAYNDIDLCLRVREAGFSVVLSAQSEMIHYESMSFGRHYSRDAAELQEHDVARFLRRWTAVCRNDPFHNPNLSLVTGQEWLPAFPPRVAKPPGCVVNSDTTH